MPAYTQKITALMEYLAFSNDLENYRDTRDKPLDEDKKALLEVLFFSGCRISEALALTSNNINCSSESVFVDFFRLKGSKQTDPIPLPRTDNLLWMCAQSGRLFDFSRTTGYRVVKRVFPRLYPHYFRNNRLTKIGEKEPLSTIISFSGLTPSAVQYYISKVDIKKVGRALKEEVQ